MVDYKLFQAVDLLCTRHKRAATVLLPTSRLKAKYVQN